MCQWWTKPRISGQIDHRAEGAGAFILCPPDHELEPGLSTRRGAHRTWFEGDVEGAVRKTPIPDLAARFAEDDDLGVRRWIGFFLPPISRAGDNFTTLHDDSTYGDLSANCGRFGLSQGCRHVGVIVVVKNPCWQHWSRITKGPRYGAR